MITVTRNVRVLTSIIIIRTANILKHVIAFWVSLKLRQFSTFAFISWQHICRFQFRKVTISFLYIGFVSTLFIIRVFYELNLLFWTNSDRISMSWGRPFFLSFGLVRIQFAQYLRCHITRYVGVLLHSKHVRSTATISVEEAEYTPFIRQKYLTYKTSTRAVFSTETYEGEKRLKNGHANLLWFAIVEVRANLRANGFADSRRISSPACDLMALFSSTNFDKFDQKWSIQ